MPTRIALALFVLLLALPAEAATRRDESHALDFELDAVVAETLVTAGTAVALFVGIEQPLACRWCASNSFDRTLRSGLLAPDMAAAELASNLVGYGLVPAVGLAGAIVPALLGDHPWDAAENVTIAANAVVATLAVTQLVKVTAARERPATHFGTDDISPDERNVSFLSGHTSLTFAVAASVATVSFLRGYRSAPWVAAGGGALALTTGLLRIAADRHWSSDVLAGMGLGTAIGVALPLLLHGRVDADGPALRILPPAYGVPAQLVVSGAW